jgi:hypothetical protein
MHLLQTKRLLLFLYRRLPIPTAKATLCKLKSAIWPIFNMQKSFKGISADLEF